MFKKLVVVVGCLGIMLFGVTNARAESNEELAKQLRELREEVTLMKGSMQKHEQADFLKGWKIGGHIIAGATATKGDAQATFDRVRIQLDKDLIAKYLSVQVQIESTGIEKPSLFLKTARLSWQITQNSTINVGIDGTPLAGIEESGLRWLGREVGTSMLDKDFGVATNALGVSYAYSLPYGLGKTHFFAGNGPWDDGNSFQGRIDATPFSGAGNLFVKNSFIRLGGIFNDADAGNSTLGLIRVGSEKAGLYHVSLMGTAAAVQASSLLKRYPELKLAAKNREDVSATGYEALAYGYPMRLADRTAFDGLFLMARWREIAGDIHSSQAAFVVGYDITKYLRVGMGPVWSSNPSETKFNVSAQVLF